MKLILCLLALMLSGCDHDTTQQVSKDLGVKKECKYQERGMNTDSFCKYTNRKGATVCVGSHGEGGFNVPCSFYEEL
jgi:hypothetical protein